ncbi:MAG: helix-turn-helix domain-containing protein [bacterium]|nr:helix-turn-helix domain-containing protein [bacterium]
MNIKKELGEKIKRLRKRSGYTQEKLAELIDISPRNLSNIEQGITFVKSETLENIIKALNVTTEELFANDHIKSSDELIDEICLRLNNIKKDKYSLEKIYRIVKCLTDEC